MPNRLARLCLWILPLAMPGFAGAQRPVTFLDILRLRTLTAPILSPDGRSAVFTVQQWQPEPLPFDPKRAEQREDARTHVWVVSTVNPSGAGEARQLTFSVRGESLPAWSPDGKLISFLANRSYAAANPIGQIWVTAPKGGATWAVTPSSDDVRAYAWSPDGRRIAFVRRELRGGYDVQDDEREDPRDPSQMLRLWVVDVATQKETNLLPDAPFSARGAPVWSPDGKQIAFAASPTPLVRDPRSNLYALTLADHALRQLTRGVSAATAPAWSPDGKRIAYLMQPNDHAERTGGHDGARDRMPLDDAHVAHLMVMDAASGRSTDLASDDFDLAAGAPLWTPNQRRLLFATYHGVYSSIYAYDFADSRYTQLAARPVVGLDPRGALSRDGKQLVYLRQSASEPDDVYMSGLDFSTPRRLTSLNSQTEDLTMAETEVVRWNGDNGWPIEGILVRPKTQAAHGYPMLVRLHGGPTDAFLNGYNLEAQYWTARGWAVFYPNPRGSTNYGERFLRASLHDWGGGDYRDIMAGVDAMIARGVADPNRLAVAGWSYGGYLSCWIIAHDHRFKAAMMGAGFTDLASLYQATDIPNYLAGLLGGDPSGENLEFYKQRSGLTYAHDVQTPLLILQGEADERVPPDQSTEMFHALEDSGKTVQLVLYPREHHNLVEFDHMLDRLERTYQWISSYTLDQH